MNYLALVIFCISILFIGFVPSQEDFVLLIGTFSLAFGSYYFLSTRKWFSIKLLLILAVALRVGLIFAFPLLSDDLYRFIWDGTLIHQGLSPYALLPSEYIANGNDVGYMHELFQAMNSPEYYSVYPPFSQLIFYLSSFSWLQSPYISAIIIKCLLLGAEIITIIYGLKLIRLMGLDDRKILWYALNPLILIEIMGNVHFEGFMVCFFMLFLYFLKQDKLNLAALFIALAISAKLIPLLFLPYFLIKWKWKKSLLFFLKIALLLLLIFSPVLFQLSGFSESLDLYFRKFEFNASIYYVLRSIGNYFYGYNMIAKIGPYMGLAVFVLTFLLAYLARQNFESFISFCLIVLTVFLLLSTTVHPWYLSLGVILSVFVRIRYLVAWSFLIILSYSKYLEIDTIHYLLIALEYSVLLLIVITDWKSIRKIFNLT